MSAAAISPISLSQAREQNRAYFKVVVYVDGKFVLGGRPTTKLGPHYWQTPHQYPSPEPEIAKPSSERRRVLASFANLSLELGLKGASVSRRLKRESLGGLEHSQSSASTSFNFASGFRTNKPGFFSAFRPLNHSRIAIAIANTTVCSGVARLRLKAKCIVGEICVLGFDLC